MPSRRALWDSRISARSSPRPGGLRPRLRRPAPVSAYEARPAAFGRLLARRRRRCARRLPTAFAGRARARGATQDLARRLARRAAAGAGGATSSAGSARRLPRRAHRVGVPRLGARERCMMRGDVPPCSAGALGRPTPVAPAGGTGRRSRCTRRRRRCRCRGYAPARSCPVVRHRARCFYTAGALAYLNLGDAHRGRRPRAAAGPSAARPRRRRAPRDHRALALVHTQQLRAGGDAWPHRSRSTCWWTRSAGIS